ncbi:EAL domain-containing protein [Burkholderia vietnamiensis]|uniref:EAL domain-containing protein n=1 Tax=Burkholderia vietnamiensis TaxID=60552 RepID=UPI0006997A3A|nr:EAL domain-containing protein [Burkholderia vietnamiensis]TPQ35170.1 EAL domain-containing protein [Burkholderia ubonensis]HDR9090170.1 EAL domain-containing protein [Burkholderia vietnamiensis]
MKTGMQRSAGIGGRGWPRSTNAPADKARQRQRIEAALQFNREPILELNDISHLLYEAREVSLSARVGMSLSTALGKSVDMTRWLDRLVMNGAIEVLRANPSVELGCAINGESATDDAWWGSVFQLLEQEPDVARRLVVELAETALLDPAAGRAFFWRLRWCGCRIAIKEFGVRYGVQSEMAVRDPDFIKLDPTLLCAAHQSGRGERRLAQLLKLASESAPCVIVDGVETNRDAALANDVGAKWAQFRYLQDA